MKNKIVIDAMDHARHSMVLNVEVRVVNLRWVKVRLWLAVQICRLAAKIGGIGLNVNQQVGVIITDKEGPNKELAIR